MGPGETLLGLCIRYVHCTPYGVHRRSTEESRIRGNPLAKRFTATQQLQNPDVELPNAAILTFESRKSLLCTDQDALVRRPDRPTCDRAPGVTSNVEFAHVLGMKPPLYYIHIWY